MENEKAIHALRDELRTENDLLFGYRRLQCEKQRCVYRFGILMRTNRGFDHRFFQRTFLQEIIEAKKIVPFRGKNESLYERENSIGGGRYKFRFRYF